MTPRINYKLLGNALSEYEKRGYTYVEVPWAVEEGFIRATLPAHLPSLTMCVETSDSYEEYTHTSRLVGSAEQGFLSLRLAPGAYVGVTPCFRIEEHNDLLHQDMFMKIELFVTCEDASVDRVMGDAMEVMALFAGRPPVCMITDEGADLTLGGIEVGSYGERTFHDQKWVYGTGLALPRFSVAKALSDVI